MGFKIGHLSFVIRHLRVAGCQLYFCNNCHLIFTDYPIHVFFGNPFGAIVSLKVLSLTAKLVEKLDPNSRKTTYNSNQASTD